MFALIQYPQSALATWDYWKRVKKSDTFFFPVPSRSSSVASLNNREDLDRMVMEGQNSRMLVEENLARNIGLTPDSNGRPGWTI